MDINRLLNIAESAAKEAGKHLISYHNTIVDKEEGRDVKLRADKEAERIILDRLVPTGITIVSEECGLIQGTNSIFYWIVDPLDGSLNYLKDISLCCVSIALWRGENEPVFGVIFDFNHNRLYKGVVGENAWCNDEMIRVSQINQKSRAIISTGFTMYIQDEKGCREFVQILKDYKKVRLFGTAAFSCALVAQGAIEVYHERSKAWWDVAAGIAIVLAAGGSIFMEVTDRERHLLNVFLSNGLIKK